MYSCFLDASKSFDKVHYGKLFNLMLKRSVPSVRFILDGYTRHRMCAQWERHCHELSVETIRPSKRKKGDTRNKEYMEAIKEQTQSRK